MTDLLSLRRGSADQYRRPFCETDGFIYTLRWACDVIVFCTHNADDFPAALRPRYVLAARILVPRFTQRTPT